jgi:type IV pilus assembly protein PilM
MAEGKLLVGVDIGASSIKVVQLKESRRALTIVRYGHIELPRDTIIDGHVMNPSAVTEALQQVFASAKISQKEVAFGVYGQSVIVRKIAMPLMTKEELAESIGWEAEQHIPFDIKQMSYDYEVLARFPEEQRMDVLLVAAKRDLAEIRRAYAVLKEERDHAEMQRSSQQLAAATTASQTAAPLVARAPWRPLRAPERRRKRRKRRAR